VQFNKDDSPLLVDAWRTGASRAILEAITKDRDRERHRLEKDGHKMSNDVLRYKLGRIGLANEILRLPEKAQKGD
jgi:hypothetical protein